ncbi:hypothetical protein [Qipengyuania oceanensis]|uniref:Uncharacterized protein n=1 Tax=Qipengyuania oceanensis TaxID=1463597 RepID=A0A844YHL0_9SPHN|nr:hypothetical protein [Qipengyuania oceanensis]MXO63392.1 hypothetical protein [Qipengyuania oceanensis]
MARDWRLGLLIAYAVAVFAMMVHAGQPEDIAWFGTAALFLLFAIAPVALLCLTRSDARAKGIAAAVIALGGLFLYVDALYIADPDPQSALVFAVVPVLQLAASAIVMLALWLMRRTGKRD